MKVLSSKNILKYRLEEPEAARGFIASGALRKQALLTFSHSLKALSCKLSCIMYQKSIIKPQK